MQHKHQNTLFLEYIQSFIFDDQYRNVNLKKIQTNKTQRKKKTKEPNNISIYIRQWRVQFFFLFSCIENGL